MTEKRSKVCGDNKFLSLHQNDLHYMIWTENFICVNTVLSPTKLINLTINLCHNSDHNSNWHWLSHYQRRNDTQALYKFSVCTQCKTIFHPPLKTVSQHYQCPCLYLQGLDLIPFVFSPLMSMPLLTFLPVGICIWRTKLTHQMKCH